MTRLIVLPFRILRSDPDTDFLAFSLPDAITTNIARHLAHVGAPDLALPVLQRAVAGGHFCYPAMAADPWLDVLRNEPEFRSVMMTAKVRCEHAAARFVSLGGAALLA